MTRKGDVVRVARVDAARVFSDVHKPLVEAKADHVGKNRAARRALRQVIVHAADARDDACDAAVEIERGQHSLDSILCNCRKKVLQVEIDDVTAAKMGSSIGLDRPMRDKPVNRVARAIHHVKPFGDLALNVFQSSVWCADQAQLVLAFRDREVLVHPLAVIPNLLELSRADTEIRQERSFARKLWRDAYAKRLAEQRSPIRHEVSLPITPACRSVAVARTSCADISSYAAVTTARMRREPRFGKT